jgi:hypothetical protein
MVVEFEVATGAEDEVRLKQIVEQVILTRCDLSRWEHVAV